MTFSRAAGLAIFTAITVLGPLQAGILTQFTLNAEGWTALTGSSNVTLVPPTATPTPVTFDPGGFITVTDSDGEDTFFRAPAAYLGNQSYAYGRALTFQIYNNPNGGSAYAGPTVVLKGGGMTLIFALPTQIATPNTWVDYTVTLAEGPLWYLNDYPGAPQVQPTALQFQTVLGNLSELWISAETTYGIIETVSLDNVNLPSTSDIPEPSTYAMVGVAGVALAASKKFLRK